MNQEQFVNNLLEYLFVHGFDADRGTLSSEVHREWTALGKCPDFASFATKCTQCIWLARPAVSPDRQMPASPSAGASEKWLAVHEAGHAVVGIQAGLFLKGIRFFGANGYPGQTGLEDPPWQSSSDKKLLRRLIRVDVAGNIAALLHPGCTAPEGRLSEWYDDRTPGDRPTDFICADARAVRLGKLLLKKKGGKVDKDELWKLRRSAVEKAERKAERILRANQRAIDELSERLLRGPMSGAEVRALLESIS